MYVCIYICIYVYRERYTYAYIYIYIYNNEETTISAAHDVQTLEELGVVHLVGRDMYACVYVVMYIHIYIYRERDICIYIHTYIYRCFYTT